MNLFLDFTPDVVYNSDRNSSGGEITMNCRDP